MTGMYQILTTTCISNEFDYENQEVGDLVASSEDWQTGSAYDIPMEYISLDVPDSAIEGRFYALFVTRVR